MADDRDPVCFTCGLPVAPAPRINRLASGAPCPTCRERLLDALPPLLPRPVPASLPAEDEPLPPDAFGPLDDGFADGPASA